jgi:hypothetical protein
MLDTILILAVNDDFQPQLRVTLSRANVATKLGWPVGEGRVGFVQAKLEEGEGVEVIDLKRSDGGVCLYPCESTLPPGALPELTRIRRLTFAGTPA